ncbi:lyase family protein [Streptomyces sp. NPDC051956]|uniref:lyase family protein n=1 Tax=Streptomyces sp. NPDC051956 TaxID=3365677 RepID=UPI0037D8ADFE
MIRARLAGRAGRRPALEVLPQHLDVGLLSPVRAGTAVESAVSDHEWLAALLDAETALVRAHARLGTVPRAAAQTITEAALADGFDLTPLAIAVRRSGHPVTGLVQGLTALVRERDPAAARFVHLGVCAQDILDTASMLVSRRSLELIIIDLDYSTEALVRLARTYRDAPMATAVPGAATTFGLRAAGWLLLMRETAKRLRRLADSLPVQIGGGDQGAADHLATEARGPDGEAGSLAEVYADELDLAVPELPWHDLRTPVADVAGAMAAAAGALGRVAADVHALSAWGTGEVAEPARPGGPSLVSDQGPPRTLLIRAAAQQVPPLALVLQASALGGDPCPGGAWYAEYQPLSEVLRLVGGAARSTAGLLRGLTVRPERMRALLAPSAGEETVRRVVSAALVADRVVRG